MWHLNDWLAGIKENSIQHFLYTDYSFGNKWSGFMGSFPLLVFSHSLQHKCIPRFHDLLANWKRPGCNNFCMFSEALKHILGTGSLAPQRANEVPPPGTNLSHMLICKCCFRAVCMLPSNMPVLPAMSFTQNQESCSITACYSSHV